MYKDRIVRNTESACPAMECSAFGILLIKAEPPVAAVKSFQK